MAARHFLASIMLMLGLCSMAVMAETYSAEGIWKTIDDATDEPKSLVKITVTPQGELTGTVIKLFKNPTLICDKCEGIKKDQPVVGMQILWGLTPSGDGWKNGKILDPKEGKIYTATLKLLEDGDQLRVRGYIGPFFRTQIWLRENGE